MAIFWRYTTCSEPRYHEILKSCFVIIVLRSESTASSDVQSGWIGSGVAHAILCMCWCTFFFGSSPWIAMATCSFYEMIHEIIYGIIDTSTNILCLLLPIDAKGFILPIHYQIIRDMLIQKLWNPLLLPNFFPIISHTRSSRCVFSIFFTSFSPEKKPWDFHRNSHWALETGLFATGQCPRSHPWRSGDGEMKGRSESDLGNSWRMPGNSWRMPGKCLEVRIHWKLNLAVGYCKMQVRWLVAGFGNLGALAAAFSLGASKDDKTDSAWTAVESAMLDDRSSMKYPLGPGFCYCSVWSSVRASEPKSLSQSRIPTGTQYETEQKQQSRSDPKRCWWLVCAGSFRWERWIMPVFPAQMANWVGILNFCHSKDAWPVLWCSPTMVVLIPIFPCVLRAFLDALRQISGRSTCRSWSLAICSRVTTMMTRPARRKWAECTWCIMGSHTLPGILKGLGDGRWI